MLSPGRWRSSAMVIGATTLSVRPGGGQSVIPPRTERSENRAAGCPHAKSARWQRRPSARCGQTARNRRNAARVGFGVIGR